MHENVKNGYRQFDHSGALKHLKNLKVLRGTDIDFARIKDKEIIDIV